jgi:hypothetical protein
MTPLSIEPAGSADFGPCPCCGNNSRRVWGYVHSPKTAVAAYFVQWTVNRVRDHGATFDLIIGKWGEGASARDRVLVALAYRLDDAGPSFMVIDADDRPAADSELVGQALARKEVIGKRIANKAFDIVDTILAQDRRIAELLESESKSDNEPSGPKKPRPRRKK